MSDSEPDVHEGTKTISCPDPKVTSKLSVIITKTTAIEKHLVELNGHNADAAAKISSLERINIEAAAARQAKHEEREKWQKREDDRKDKEDHQIRQDIGNSRLFLGWVVSIAAFLTGAASFVANQIWG